MTGPPIPGRPSLPGRHGMRPTPGTARGETPGMSFGPAAGPAVPAGSAGSAPGSAQEEALDYPLVRRLQARVADLLTREQQDRAVGGQPPLSSADLRQRALSVAGEVVSAYMSEQLHARRELPDSGYDLRLIQAIDAAMYGAGELQVLLDDHDIENIDINGHDGVWITRAGQREPVRGRPIAASDEELIELIRNLGAYAGLNARPFTPASPELDLRLPDGSRLSAVMRASERPLISIRRNRYPQMFLDQVPPTARRGPEPPDGPPSSSPAGRLEGRRRRQGPRTLLQLGTVTEELASFLQAAVLARCNIIVAGATDAGKTTLLRALINCIPPHERLVTIERALELGLSRHPELHPNVAEMEEVLPSPEGGGGLSIRQLVQRSRRQNPSRVIVGEVMGPEVVEMLQAMSQGNDGSLSTLHARNAADAFARLATYAAMHNDLPSHVTHELTGGAVDFVVFIRKNPYTQAQRAVMEVLEVTGSHDGHVTRSRIFREGSDGRAERDPEVAITRGPQLAAHGYPDGYPASYPTDYQAGWEAPPVSPNGWRDQGGHR